MSSFSLVSRIFLAIELSFPGYLCLFTLLIPAAFFFIPAVRGVSYGIFLFARIIVESSLYLRIRFVDGLLCAAEFDTTFDAPCASFCQQAIDPTSRINVPPLIETVGTVSSIGFVIRGMRSDRTNDRKDAFREDGIVNSSFGPNM
jgi:hypothetical protein